MRKRRIYLVLIIIILIIEFGVILFGNKEKNTKKVNGEISINTVIITNEEISENKVENNIIENKIENKVKVSNESNANIVNNAVENKIKNINTIEQLPENKVESKNEVIEEVKVFESNVITQVNESYFENGHLKNYPDYRRTIWTADNK